MSVRSAFSQITYRQGKRADCKHIKRAAADAERTGILSGYFWRIRSASALRFSVQRISGVSLGYGDDEQRTKGVLVLELGSHDGCWLREGRMTRTESWTDVVVYSQAGNGRLEARAALGDMSQQLSTRRLTAPHDSYYNSTVQQTNKNKCGISGILMTSLLRPEMQPFRVPSRYRRQGPIVGQTLSWNHTLGFAVLPHDAAPSHAQMYHALEHQSSP